MTESSVLHMRREMCQQSLRWCHATIQTDHTKKHPTLSSPVLKLLQAMPMWYWSQCSTEMTKSFSSCLSCWFINCRFPCFIALSEADCPEKGCGEDATMSFYVFGQLCLPISFFGLEYACRHMLAERIIPWPIYYRINLRQGVTGKPQNGVAVHVLKMLLQSVITIVITMLL